MPYTAEPPARRESADELRARIPGWGADLDPRDRPSVPREVFDPQASNAHWHRPESQEGSENREHSIEHSGFPSVFGTAVPLRGLSGATRRMAYRRYSEARAAHWLLLLLGDRIDAIESHVLSFATTRPDNPVTQTGVLSEGRRHGLRSRYGRGRADTRHSWLDPIVVAGPWVLAAGALALAVRAVARSR